MEKLNASFDELKKLYEADPEKTLSELQAFIARKFNYLARVGNLLICPTEVVISEGKAKNLDERLKELGQKFSAGIYVFGNQEEWYENAKFKDQSVTTAHLCKAMDWLSVQSAILGLKELNVEKKFTLPQALLFAEKIFDDSLLKAGEILSIMLSDTVKVSGSSCTILVEHFPNDTWQLSFYLYNGTGSLYSNHYILCK